MNLSGKSTGVRRYSVVCKLPQNGDLAKSHNTLKTVPGAINPFVQQQARGGAAGADAATPSAASSQSRQ